MSHSIKVFAPGTVANVGCGFDVLGFAIHGPGDKIIMRLNEAKKVSVESITGDNGSLSKKASENTASVAVLAMLKKLKSKQGLSIELHKQMPLKSGLGSSAASAVAGVFALNELLHKPFSKEELIPFAMEGERVACGSAHADNVAPSMLGGLVLVRSLNPLQVIKINSPSKLFCCVVHPHLELATKKSRAALPKQIPLQTAVKQWANVGGLVAGFMKKDFALIGSSIEDFVAEPNRSKLIKGFDAVKKAAMKAGALGCSISGSGPTVFALSDDKEKCKLIANAMQAAFLKVGVGSEQYVSKINNQGVKIIS